MNPRVMNHSPSPRARIDVLNPGMDSDQFQFFESLASDLGSATDLEFRSDSQR